MKKITTLCMLLFSFFTYAQDNKQPSVDSLVHRYIGTDKNQFIAIGIIESGRQQIFTVGQGVNNRSEKVSPAKAIFELGELSSLFTTTLLARMATEGELSLETPLQDLMPYQRLPVYQKLNCEPVGLGYSIYACDPKSSDETIPILLCNLATHTAGFPAKPATIGVRLHPKNPYARYTKEDLYRYLNNYPISFTSGFTYHYSHMGMALLGHGLSLKASLPYEKLLQTGLLEPLGLTNTYHRLPADVKNKMLQGYTYTGKPAKAWEFDVLAPSAGLHANIEDMLQFLSIHMGVSQKDWLPAVRLAQTPRETIPNKELKGTKVALGWLISPLPGTVEEVIWMEGKTGGFASYIGFTSDYTRGVVILSNQAKPVREAGIRLLKTLQTDAIQRTVHVPVSGK